LVVQGRYTTSGVNIVSEIKGINGLSLDRKNRARLTELTPITQNALECDNCGDHGYLIESKTEGLDIIFHNECGHDNNVKSPFLMCVNRILPDINMLKSRNLSRLIELGYFENCEILIPQYMMDCLDEYLSGSKHTISGELAQLRELQGKDLIDIYNFNDNMEIPKSREEFNRTEDNTLIEISIMTNSIFLTSDINCKDKALLKNRPTIFLDHDTTKSIKILHETRLPE
jgi:hypothetical protein